MLELADSQKSWHMAEAVETSDAASSSGTALTAGLHLDVEYIASWLSDQVETVKDARRACVGAWEAWEASGWLDLQICMFPQCTLLLHTPSFCVWQLLSGHGCSWRPCFARFRCRIDIGASGHNPVRYYWQDRSRNSGCWSG